MKLEDYKSGNHINMGTYKAFIPSKINYNWGWDDTKLDNLLAEANRQIGELNAYSILIPNVDLYIKMHVKIEANKSSKIEGTRTTIEEDLMDIADINPEKRDDWEEVQNYVKAINYGIERVKDGFPVCTRLIRDIHKVLMTGVRGEHKTPGEFRISQNWIGGSMPSKAVYVPPPHTEIADLLTDFEMFINNEEVDTPDLIKIAILHYQFESIHPFLDGNGRIGRLLILLYIQSKGMLEKSCLYISDYIERNKDEYYDCLTRARTNNDIIGWIKFFLEAVIETSKTAKNKFKKVVEFTQEIDNEIVKFPVKTENVKKVVDFLYNEPQVTRNKLVEGTGIKLTTINGIVKVLLSEGIIKEVTGYTRNQIFVFEKYINLFR
ncbi:MULTISPECIES: Fic family protein [Campylobacter]|uniref:Fic family protein n=1 Tax=Campylobacter TaxID=194 RepID=UPI000A33233C|nr:MULTISPECIES: Fic family protein [Campylobacter]MDY3133527.1 Fic family protein [Campylobacter lanienae]MDY6134969.1 Fic family protein [Campylobacter lanienae]